MAKNDIGELIQLMQLMKMVKEMKKERAQSDYLVDTTEQLQNTMKEIPSGRIGGNIAKLMSAIGVGPAPEVQKYKSLTALIMGPFARQVMMEKGVLSEQDIKRVREALPQITGTDRERAAAFDILYGGIRKGLNPQAALPSSTEY